MPYEILERNGKHCVAKKDGEVLKCYAEKDQATAYLRALYANVTAAAMPAKDFNERYQVGQRLAGRHQPDLQRKYESAFRAQSTKSRKAARSLTAAGFDPTKHPRHQKGVREGGRFTDRGGAPETVPTVYLANSQSDTGGYIQKPGVYLRFGDLPVENGAVVPSMNGLTGIREKGLSVYPAWHDPKTGKYVIPSGSEQYLATQSEVDTRPAYRVRGVDTGETGDDGEPLLDHTSVTIEEKVPPSQIVTEQVPYLTLDGNELDREDEPDWHESLMAAVDPQIPDGYINEQAFKDSVTKRTAAARKKMVNEVMVSLLGEAAVKGAAEEIGVLITTLAKAQAENAYLAASDAVHSALLDGLTQGLSVDQTAERVGEVMDEWAPWQAQRQAQTDLVSLSNGASLTAARILGPDAPQFKTWLSAGDDRVREAHRSLDRQTVGINDPFQFEEYSLMYPGDPAAPDGLIINCRCTQIYTDTAEASLAHSLDGGIVEDTLAMAAAAFDESKHPRNEKGADTGGEFRTKLQIGISRVQAGEDPQTVAREIKANAGEYKALLDEAGSSGGSETISSLIEKGPEVGPVTVDAYRVGGMEDFRKRGIHFGDSAESIKAYESLHEGKTTQRYSIPIKKARVFRNQFEAHEVLTGKKLSMPTREQFFAAEKRVAVAARKQGYDALIFTDPPAPAKHELVYLGKEALEPVTASAFDPAKHPRASRGVREGGRFVAVSNGIANYAVVDERTGEEVASNIKNAGDAVDLADLKNETHGALPANLENVTTIEGRTTNPVYTATQDGVKVAVKPEVQLDRSQLRPYITPGFDLPREEAAYRISERIQSIAPEFAVDVPRYQIAVDDRPGGFGVVGVSDWVEGKTYNKAGPGEAYALNSRTSALYDSLIGNEDRNWGNIIVKPDGGVALIDHGLTFPETTESRITGLPWGDTNLGLSEEEVGFLHKVKENRVVIDSQDLNGLEPAAVESFWGRVDWMLERERLF